MDRTQQTGIEREGPNEAVHGTRLRRVGEISRARCSSIFGVTNRV